LELFWFALDIPRYESKTSHLTMLQDGAYNRLIRHYYKTCSPIPANEQQIVIITKAFSTDEIEAVSFILKTFFKLESDGWHHDTCDEEIAKARRISKKRREAGKFGGLAKARKVLQQNAVKTLDNNNNSNNKKDLKTKAASAFSLPDWIPLENWNHFSEMRKRLRKPMTDRAMALIVTELYKLKSRGNDPGAVLDQSVRNSWQDVYELKGEQHGTNRQVTQQQQQPSTQVRRYNSNLAAIVGTRAAAAGAGMGDGVIPDSPGQAARPPARNNAVVEGEIKGISR